MAAALDVRDKIKSLIFEKSATLENLKERDIIFEDDLELFRWPSAIVKFNSMGLDRSTTHESRLILGYDIKIYLRQIDYKKKEEALMALLYDLMLHFEKHPNMDGLTVNTTVSGGFIGDTTGEDGTQSIYFFGFNLEVDYGLVDSVVT